MATNQRTATADNTVHHAERQLLDGVERILRNPATRQGWALLALHLSRFPAPGPRAHHRRIAAAVLEDAAGRGSGQVFALSNHDMVLLFRPGEASGALLATLTRLFQADLSDPAALRSLWPMPSGADAALTYIRGCLAATETSSPTLEQRGSASVIAMMDNVVQTAPSSELMHRQTAILLRPGQTNPIVPIFREVAISTAVLEARIAAVGQAQADPFLFSHLSVRLDRRMLTVLTDDVPGRGPLSRGLDSAALHVNLTLAGILSDAFALFASTCQAAIDDGLRIGVELPFVEVFADPMAFVLARERLKLARMLLVLDGMTHHALAISNPAVLKPDLVKLNWSPDLKQSGAGLRAAIGNFGADRIMLHRAESEAAIAWGVSQGILRYQGRYVDQMLAAERMRACPSARLCQMRGCVERAAAACNGVRGGCSNLALLDLGAPIRERLPASAISG